MKLSLAAELAIRGSTILAAEYGKGPVTLETICSKRDLPRQYLVKIFSMLSKADLIVPVRGKHGGYMLSRDPKTISLLEIIEAVEGPLILNYCQHDPPKCDEVGCPIKPLWTELQEIIRTKLDQMKLGACIASSSD